MIKQVMSILTAKDKKIKTLYPEKVAARKAIAEAVAKAEELAEKAAVTTDTTEPPAKDVQKLKLNRKTRRYLQRRTRQYRKDELRKAAKPFPTYTDENFKFRGPKKQVKNA